MLGLVLFFKGINVLATFILLGVYCLLIKDWLDHQIRQLHLLSKFVQVVIKDIIDVLISL
jgi:hypothetical protein